MSPKLPLPYPYSIKEDVIILEAYERLFIAWLYKTPIFVVVAYIFALIYTSLRIGTFIGGLMMGLVICALPLLTRHALVLTQSGIWSALVPTICPSITRMKTQDKVALYDEIARWKITKASFSYILRIDLRERGHIEFNCAIRERNIQSFREQIARWLPQEKEHI